jgi:hypothetical protein
VTIQGHDFYLGPWDTKASKTEYDRIISEWLAAGRQLPGNLIGAFDLTIVEILARYKRFPLRTAALATTSWTASWRDSSGKWRKATRA